MSLDAEMAEQIVKLNEENKVLKKALEKASKQAFGNKVSFISSNYPKRITNAEEYAEYLIFEAKGDIKMEISKLEIEKEREIIKTIQSQLKEKDKEIETLQKEKELDNIFWKQECDSLQKTLKEKDKEINILRDKLKDLKEEITECYVDGQDYVELRTQKDKEIDALNKIILRLSNEKEITNNIQNIDYLSFATQIREQVCGEIREKIKNRNEAYPIICEDENQIVHRCIFLDDIKQFLDQIEKGDVVDDNKGN